MAMLLTDFGPYGILFMTMCVSTTLDFPVIFDGQFTSAFHKHLLASVVCYQQQIFYHPMMQ
jgi:hypothetical protein